MLFFYIYIYTKKNDILIYLLRKRKNVKVFIICSIKQFILCYTYKSSTKLKHITIIIIIVFIREKLMLSAELTYHL